MVIPVEESYVSWPEFPCRVEAKDELFRVMNR